MFFSDCRKIKRKVVYLDTMLQPKTPTSTETTASTTPKVLIIMVFLVEKQLNLQLLMLVEEKMYQELQPFWKRLTLWIKKLSYTCRLQNISQRIWHDRRRILQSPMRNEPPAEGFRIMARFVVTCPDFTHKYFAVFISDIILVNMSNNFEICGWNRVFHLQVHRSASKIIFVQEHV